MLNLGFGMNNAVKKKIDKKIILTIIFLVLLNLAFISYNIKNEMLYSNEIVYAERIHTLSFFEKDSSGMNLFKGIIDENHFPIYFYIEKIFFVIFGGGYYALFIWPFIVSSALIIVFFLFLKKTYSFLTAVLVSLLYIFSFVNYIYSRETQEYLFFAFMCILTFYLLSYLVSDKKFNQKNLFKNKNFYCFISAFIILSFTHNYFVIMFILLLFYQGILLLESLSYNRTYSKGLATLLVLTVLIGSLPFLLAIKNGLYYYAVDEAGACVSSDCPFFGLKLEDIHVTVYENLNFLIDNQNPYGGAGPKGFFIKGGVLFFLFLLSVFYIIRTHFKQIIKHKAKKEQIYPKIISLWNRIFPSLAFLISFILVLTFVFTRCAPYSFTFIFVFFYLSLAGGVELILNLKIKNKRIRHILKLFLVFLILIQISFGVNSTLLRENDFEFGMSTMQFFKDMENQVDIKNEQVTYFTSNYLNSVAYYFYKNGNLKNFQNKPNKPLDEYYAFNNNSNISSKKVLLTICFDDPYPNNRYLHDYLFKNYKIEYYKNHSSYEYYYFKKKNHLFSKPHYNSEGCCKQGLYSRD